ncbi:MAG TPA: hypothetical protein VHP58_01380 [Alphaproteobacteria bacterium]|nr:hypothetical protein [Alphaproteobacteria bacterium]
MNNQTLLVVLVLLLVVGGAAYVVGQRHTESEPQGVLGNAAAAVSDKISQASEQMKADAHEQSAEDHANAAKAGLGIK